MHPSIERLLKVQEVDSEAIFLRESLRLRPRELDDDRKKVVDTQKALDDLVLKVRRLRMDSDKRELDVKQCDSEIEKLNVVLNQARSNQEYTVIKEKIQRQADLRDKAEEEVLGKLTEIDSVEALRKATSARLEQETKALRRREADVAELVRGLQGQLGTLEAKRGGLVEGIDRENLNTYERVLARHGNFAVARVEEQVCQGCYLSVTSQDVNLLMQGQFLQCKSCSRILYLA